MNSMTANEYHEAPRPLRECNSCDGTGRLPMSECCGADIVNGICSECGEHAMGEQCDICNGTGEVETDRPGDLF